MSAFYTPILIIQALSALGVIILVLLQHGKGADMGAAFGSGASGTLFGASGSANLLSRLTAGLAATFFVCTLGLAFIANNRSATGTGKSVVDEFTKLPATAPGAVPAVVPPPTAPTGVPPASVPSASVPATSGAAPAATAPAAVTPAVTAPAASVPPVASQAPTVPTAVPPATNK